MSGYDDLITLVPKGTSPTVTIVPKGTSPTVTKVEKPYSSYPNALNTEGYVDILQEDLKVILVDVS